MDDGIANSLVETETKIKYENLLEDIKTEVFDNFTAEHEIYDFKIEEYCPTSVDTTVKIEQVTDDEDVSDIFQILHTVTVKTSNDKSLHRLGNATGKTEGMPCEESSILSERKPKKSANKRFGSQRKRKSKTKEDITFVCGFCTKTYKKAKEFFSHMRFHEKVFLKNNRNKTDNVSNGDITERNICNKFKPETSEEVTTKIERKTKKQKKGGKSFKCKLCSKTFTFKSNLKRHNYTVHEKIRVICDICKKTYCKKSYLLHHIKTVHMKIRNDARLFSCKMCQKTVTTAYGLRIHMQIHTGEKPFVCNYCTKGFSNKWNLKVHLKKCTSNLPVPDCP